MDKHHCRRAAWQNLFLKCFLFPFVTSVCVELWGMEVEFLWGKNGRILVSVQWNKPDTKSCTSLSPSEHSSVSLPRSHDASAFPLLIRQPKIAQSQRLANFLASLTLRDGISRLFGGWFSGVSFWSILHRCQPLRFHSLVKTIWPPLEGCCAQVCVCGSILSHKPCGMLISMHRRSLPMSFRLYVKDEMMICTAPGRESSDLRTLAFVSLLFFFSFRCLYPFFLTRKGVHSTLRW